MISVCCQVLAGIRDRRTNTLSLFNDDDEKDELFGKPSQAQEAKAAAASNKEEKVSYK